MEALIGRLSTEVSALAQRHRELRAHADAVDAAVRQCAALFELGEALMQLQHEEQQQQQQQQDQQQQDQQQQQQQQQEEQQQQQKDQQQQDHQQQDHQQQPQQQQQGQQQQQQQQPVAPTCAGGSGAASSGATQCSSLAAQVGAAIRQVLRQHHQLQAGLGHGAAAAHPADLGWRVAAVHEAAVRGSFELTTAGLRRAVRDFVKASAILAPRIRWGAPDAPRALALLSEARARLAAHNCLLLLSGVLLPLSEVVVEPLDADEDDSLWGAQGAPGALPSPLLTRAPGAPRWPPSVEVPAEHWIWAARQMALGPEQEDRVWAMLQIHNARITALRGRSQELLQQLQSGEGDFDLRQERLEEVERLQRLFQVEAIVSGMTIACSLVRPEQLGSWYLAAWPYSPSISSLYNAFKVIRSQPRTQAARPLPRPLRSLNSRDESRSGQEEGEGLLSEAAGASPAQGERGHGQAPPPQAPSSLA